MNTNSTRHPVSGNGGRILRRLLPLLTVAITAIVIPAPAQALVINPTFETGLSTAAEAVINTAIGFYESTFSNNITVNIDFHNMTSGLGESEFLIYNVSYSNYRNALVADATSANDTTALTSLPAGSVDPVIGNSAININAANGQALGFNTPGSAINDAFCSTGSSIVDGCIGLNLSLINSASYSLLATVEHEIDEVLGLGSSLSGNGTIFNNKVSPEDLFRYSALGARSFALNASCPGSTAYFSINGGLTNLDAFNNCTNGGDYGDWISGNTPVQVQDAYGTPGATPSLTVGSVEVTALDVIGYTLKQQTTVPEPTGVALFGVGFAGLFMARRRAQHKKNISLSAY